MKMVHANMVSRFNKIMKCVSFSRYIIVNGSKCYVMINLFYVSSVYYELTFIGPEFKLVSFYEKIIFKFEEMKMKLGRFNLRLSVQPGHCPHALYFCSFTHLRFGPIKFEKTKDRVWAQLWIGILVKPNVMVVTSN